MDRPGVLPEQHRRSAPRHGDQRRRPRHGPGAFSQACTVREGTGKPGALNLASPYPYTNAWDHYQALLKEAKGGTKHTKTTIPDWSGRWMGGAVGLNGGPNPASYVASMLTPKYREYFVQEVKAYTEGRIWSRRLLLPSGRILRRARRRRVHRHARSRLDARRRQRLEHHALDLYRRQRPQSEGRRIPQVARGIDRLLERRSARSFTPTRSEAGKVVSPSSATSSRPSSATAAWATASRARSRCTIPTSSCARSHARLRFELDPETRPELRPLFNTCTDTNGPVVEGLHGRTRSAQRAAHGDPLYWDAADPRPWGTVPERKRQEISALPRFASPLGRAG